MEERKHVLNHISPCLSSVVSIQKWQLLVAAASGGISDTALFIFILFLTESLTLSNLRPCPPTSLSCQLKKVLKTQLSRYYQQFAVSLEYLRFRVCIKATDCARETPFQSGAQVWHSRRVTQILMTARLLFVYISRVKPNGFLKT